MTIMRFAFVRGTVTLSQSHPSFQGATLKLASPIRGTEFDASKAEQEDAIVVWDELGAGLGDLVAFSEGAEAAQPFQPEIKPVDAYNAALIDNMNIKSK